MATVSRARLRGILRRADVLSGGMLSTKEDSRLHVICVPSPHMHAKGKPSVHRLGHPCKCPSEAMDGRVPRVRILQPLCAQEVLIPLKSRIRFSPAHRGEMSASETQGGARVAGPLCWRTEVCVPQGSFCHLPSAPAVARVGKRGSSSLGLWGLGVFTSCLPEAQKFPLREGDVSLVATAPECAVRGSGSGAEPCSRQGCHSGAGELDKGGP